MSAVFLELRATIADFEAKMQMAAAEVRKLEESAAKSAEGIGVASESSGKAFSKEAEEAARAAEIVKTSEAAQRRAAEESAVAFKVAAEEKRSAMRGVLSDFAAMVPGVGGPLTSMAARTESLGGKFKTLGSDAEHLGGKTVRAGADIGSAAGGIESAGAKVGGLAGAGGPWGMVAAAVVITGAAAAAAGVKFVGMASQFDQSTSRFQTAAGETANGLKVVRDGILNLSTSVAIPIDQMNTGMFQIEKAGHHGAEGLTVLKAAAQGAQAEQADMGDTTKGLLTIMQDYHIKVGDAATTMSKLVTASGDSLVPLQDFTGALDNVAPVAATAHIKMDDVVATLASMTQHGISADQATQNMRNAIMSLTRPTTLARTSMAGLGIDSRTLANSLSQHGLSGTMSMLSQTILQHMGPSGKVLFNVFNQSKAAGDSLNTMLEHAPGPVKALAKEYTSGSIGMGAFSKSARALKGDQGAQAMQFLALSKSAHGFSNALKSGGGNVQNYLQALRNLTGNSTAANVAAQITGENMSTTNRILKDVDKTTAGAGNTVKGYGESQKNTANKVKELKNSFHAIGVQIGQELEPAFNKVVDVVKKAASFLEHHKQVAKALAITLGVLAGAVALLVAAVVVGVLLLAAPFAAIAYGIYELIKHWRYLWDVLKTGAHLAWSWLNTHVFKPLEDFFTKTVPDIFEKVVKTAKDGWHKFTSALTDAWNTSIAWLKSLPRKAYDAMKELDIYLYRKAHEAWDSFKKACAEKWDELKSWVQSIPGKIKDVLSDAGSWLLQAGHDLIVGLWNGIANMGSWLWDQIKGFASNVISGFKSFLGIQSPSKYTKEHGRYLVEGLAAGIRDNSSVAADAVQHLSNQVLAGSKGLSVSAGVAMSTDLTASLSTAAVGRLGAVSATGGTTLVVNVQGSAVTERDLAATLEKHMLQIGGRRPTTYTNYRR